MKKILGFYLPLLFIVGLIGFFLLLFAATHQSAAKTFIGEGKIIYPAKSAVIKIDGVESTNSTIFESEGRFYFVKNDSKITGFDMLVIDKSRNDVALPNGGCRDVVFSNFLFLADCGYGGVFYSDKVKMEGFDTQLKISDSNITFILPNHKNFIEPEHKIEILFKGE